MSHEYFSDFLLNGYSFAGLRAKATVRGVFGEAVARGWR
jgi:hypothetical protein